MYMTIREFQHKLNNVLRANKNIDLDTLITSAMVVKPGDPCTDRAPIGTLVFLCQNCNSIKKPENGGYSDNWFELTIYPDQIGQVLM